MDNDDPHDIAAQQAAAEDYLPAHESSLVGSRLPCENITNEYAKADPIYVEKTLALPQTYSHYRPVRGDGNCGWRAIGFSYFEKLAELGDQAKMQAEFARLTAYNQLLETVGNFDYWEDFADPAMELLTELAALATDTTASLSLVFERWNDEDVTNAIIYYLRLLASTYLKQHAEQYDPFVPTGGGVLGYCDMVIQPVNREIEHLGIVALSNVLLKPIGVVLEIAYLDRSEGSTVNHHRPAEDGTGQGTVMEEAVVYLLYRPDHYDILYRREGRQPSTENEGIVYQVNRAELLPTTVDINSTPAIGGMSGLGEMDFGLLSSLIPNYFDVSPGGSMGHADTGDAMMDTFAPQQNAWASPYEGGLSASTPMVPPSTEGVSTNPSTPMTTESSSTPTGTAAASASGSTSANDCQIRFSNAQFDYDGIPDQFQVQTSTFKNSVYNTAHYRNPNFQPEECHPDGEVSERRLSARRKKRQDS